MSGTDLALTARLVGLPLEEVWVRYVAVGGTASLAALTARISGACDWSPREDLFLAVTLHDALIDDPLVDLEPFEGLLSAAPPGAGRPVAHGALPVGPDRRAVPASGGSDDLAALCARSRDVRAEARSLRGMAREARRRPAAPEHLQPVGPVLRSQRRQQRESTDARRVQALLEDGPQIRWHADATGRLLHSPTWRAFAGRSVAQWAHDGWLATVHPADRQHARANWALCLAEDLPVRTHVRLWSAAAQEWRLTLVRAVPLHDADGRRTTWVGANTVVGT